VNGNAVNPGTEGGGANGAYDVIVVGAGPAGATAAYYLARGTEQQTGKRVGLLERARFPRDKYCGDAWCAPALDILEDMGVLQRLEAEGLVQDTTSGGFISPSGESYVSTGDGGTAPGTRCYAIKRIICDEHIARRAAEVGADLHENAAVATTTLQDDGLWTVTCHDGRRFRSKMLVAADGATSQVARSLGVVTTPPEGVACRQYVQGGSHNFKSGGVLFYPRYILPGYVALFRHYDDDIDLGCYVIPGGAVTADRLIELYKSQIKSDPFIQRALGPRVVFKEPVRVASLRLGGVERSTSRQFMAVGDAAGQTDPLTGEGIHTGMIGGKLAAQTIHEMFARGDFSEDACQVYHRRWMAAFGRDFSASAVGARLVYRFPLFMDAANVVAQRKGDAFMSDFGAVMTGVKPKTTFLRPGVAIPLGLEVLRQAFSQKLLRPRILQQDAYATRATEETDRETSFARGCIIDQNVDVSHLEEDASESQERRQALAEIFRHAVRALAVRRVLVLYGSEYGFSERVAHLLCEALAGVTLAGDGPSLSPRCVSMADHEIVDWNEITTCLLICSTAGDGMPPTAASPLFELLASGSLDLSGLRYATLALGDRSYPHFCRAGRTLDARLQELGATPLMPRVDVDREDMDVVRSWISSVSASLSDAAIWEDCPPDPPDDPLLERARRRFSGPSDEPAEPTRAAPFMARMRVKRSLTRIVEPSDREIIHIELDVSAGGRAEASPIRWEPGDALGVVASNCPDEVAAVLEELNASGDEMVPLPEGKGSASLREALLGHLNIKDVPPELLGLLMDAAATPAERELSTILRETSSSSYREQREIQDVLRDFPSGARALGAERLAGLLRPLRPRYYTIASSPRTASDRICLTVGVVRYESLGRLRKGLASTYLADRVKEGDTVPVFVHRDPRFRLPPAEARKSCVMIGSGSGIAPFRAFIQELVDRNRSPEGSDDMVPSSDTPHLLFFGCQHEERDFLYKEELRAWESQGGLRLITAFSQGQPEGAVVQDRILENGAMLWEYMASGHYVYVCVDSARMASSVEQALREAIRIHGARSSEEAKAYLAKMRSQGRLHLEAWPA
jgi:geranylgeranyl reductase family protein